MIFFMTFVPKKWNIFKRYYSWRGVGLVAHTQNMVSFYKLHFLRKKSIKTLSLPFFFFSQCKSNS